MSTATADGNFTGVDLSFLLKAWDRVRTGGQLPKGSKPVVYVIPATYAVQVMAIVDKFII